MATPSSDNTTGVRKMVECPVCLDEYKDPRRLPCQHTLCRECLRQVMRSHTGRVFPCPACRADTEKPRYDSVRAFPAAHCVNRLIDTLKIMEGDCDQQGRLIMFRPLLVIISEFIL